MHLSLTGAHRGWLECPELIALPWLVHAFSLRTSGDFRSPAPGSLQQEVLGECPSPESGRSRFAAMLGVADFQIASARQIHSSEAVRVDRKNGALQYQLCEPRPGCASSERDPAADALLTQEPGVLLSVRTADCLPVLIADTQRRAVAAVHAGWRGTLQHIVGKTVGEMQRSFGSRSRDLVVALGPSIRACCYVVGQEVREAFRGRFTQSDAFFRAGPGASASSTGTPPQHKPSTGPEFCLDLITAAQAQLAEAGVPPGQVHVLDFCTSCRTDLFFSYRKEGAATGRMMAVVGIREIAAGRSHHPHCRGGRAGF